MPEKKDRKFGTVAEQLADVENSKPVAIECIQKARDAFIVWSLGKSESGGEDNLHLSMHGDTGLMYHMLVNIFILEPEMRDLVQLAIVESLQ